MLITLEGIDSSGKSTVANMLKTLICNKQLTCVQLNKKKPIIGDTEAQSYADSLSSLIWAVGSEKVPFSFLNSTGWLIQLSLWYYFLKNNCLPRLIDTYDYVIIDGWFYKLYARMRQDSTIDKKLLSILLDLCSNDHTHILLQVDPELCWKRRSDFGLTEIAAWGVIPKNKHDSFVTFQNCVQNELLALAKDRQWIIYHCGQESSSQIANNIMNTI
jgi:thymidylate kinase